MARWLTKVAMYLRHPYNHSDVVLSTLQSWDLQLSLLPSTSSTTCMVPVLLCHSQPYCTMVMWSYFLHQPHAVTTHLQSIYCMWLLIFKVLCIIIRTALHDTWRVISPFCNIVPGLHLLPKNSVRCLSVLAPFGSALLAVFGDEQNYCCPCSVTAAKLGCAIVRGPCPAA